MFRPDSSITLDNADSVLEAGLQAIAAGQTEIDLGQLASVDSAAVATLLAWRRAARTNGAGLAFRNAPPNLLSLVDLYDANELLSS